MKTIEIFLINLFMMGKEFSTSTDGRKFRDTTFIQCEGYTFEFKQQNIKLKQSECVNKTILTTIVTIHDITEDQIPLILEIIDNICWLLSFAQQSLVVRHGYKLNSTQESFNSCLGIIVNPLRSIINDHGEDIRNFIEQTYSTFKKIKSSRQLTIVIGYLCEANRSSLALEISLISHYVVIENLKHTFALDNRYEYLRRYYVHKDFPPLDHPPQNLDKYLKPKGSRKKYVHKIHGQVSSTEMTLRMFEAANFNRNEISDFLDKRNKIIHEGILLPFGNENYMEQAIKDKQAINDLIREYLLTILDYQGAYYRNSDRVDCSVCLI